MKAIKVIPANAAAIESALHAVNGHAREWTFTTYAEIEAMANVEERRLECRWIPKSARAGARLFARSGQTVANAYKSTRIATLVTLERRSSGWYLTRVAKTMIFPNQGGRRDVWLTPAQDAIAVAGLRREYSVLKPVAVEQPETVPA